METEEVLYKSESEIVDWTRDRNRRGPTQIGKAEFTTHAWEQKKRH
jgi:hypothetical protein